MPFGFSNLQKCKLSAPQCIKSLRLASHAGRRLHLVIAYFQGSTVLHSVPCVAVASAYMPQVTCGLQAQAGTLKRMLPLCGLSLAAACCFRKKRCLPYSQVSRKLEIAPLYGYVVTTQARRLGGAVAVATYSVIKHLLTDSRQAAL